MALPQEPEREAAASRAHAEQDARAGRCAGPGRDSETMVTVGRR